MTADTARAPVLATVVELLSHVLEVPPDRAATITAGTRLEEDLQVESVDLLRVAELLRARFGERVDVLSHVTELDIDELIALTVGDLAGYVTRALDTAR